MYCEDGYFAIDSIDNFFLAKSQSWKQANSTLDILDAPKDVRLDKFITLVDTSGQAMTIIRKSNSDVSQIGLDVSAGGELPQIIGGFITPDFVVIYISNEGQKFLQVHMAKTSLKQVAALEGNILAYEILDLVHVKDMFYVYAIQEHPITRQRKLLSLQIVYDSNS